MNAPGPHSTDPADSLVEEASRESFPASDPPSYTVGLDHEPVGTIRLADADEAAGSGSPANDGGTASSHGTKAKTPDAAGQTVRDRSPAPQRFAAPPSPCCQLSSETAQRLLVAATIAGVAVGALLVTRYVNRA